MSIYGHYTLSNIMRRHYKHRMNKKHRQIGKHALNEIKKEFNNLNKHDYTNYRWCLRIINFDKVIKDRSYLKKKSRQVCGGMYGDNIEQRCSGSRTYFVGFM